jgi:hypothetical protein
METGTASRLYFSNRRKLDFRTWTVSGIGWQMPRKGSPPFSYFRGDFLDGAAGMDLVLSRKEMLPN